MWEVVGVKGHILRLDFPPSAVMIPDDSQQRNLSFCVEMHPNKKKNTPTKLNRSTTTEEEAPKRQ